jgi:hypothetical protein
MPSRGAKPQLLRGTAGFVVPDLAALWSRLDFVAREMRRVAPDRPNSFAFAQGNDCVELTCPWGNRIRCHAPSAAWGGVELGLVYLDFDVAPGSADGIARFYQQVMKAPARREGRCAVVQAGAFQQLRFTETDGPIAEYDGHHFQIYLADFSSPYRWLQERDLLSLDVDPHEWRIQWICDPQDGQRLFQVEHEVRSMQHPLYNRPLVNRNTAATNLTYARGREAFSGAY